MTDPLSVSATTVSSAVDDPLSVVVPSVSSTDTIPVDSSVQDFPGAIAWVVCDRIVPFLVISDLSNFYAQCISVLYPTPPLVVSYCLVASILHSQLLAFSI